MDAKELLAKHAELLNRHWPNTLLADKLVEKYSHNSEFVELAGLAKTLKAARQQRKLNRMGF